MDATLEVNLDADFLAAAGAAQRQLSGIVADRMREFGERERSGCTDFLRRKVEKARQSAKDGRRRTNVEIERDVAVRRQAVFDADDDLGA